MKGKYIIYLCILISLFNASFQDDDFLDISSFANINQIQQNKIDIDLNIDFDNQKYYRFIY